MKPIQQLFLLLFALLVTMPLAAQEARYPLREVQGAQYYVYQMKQAEGYYALKRKFGITEEEVKRYNPTLQDAELCYGDEVLIPIHYLPPTATIEAIEAKPQIVDYEEYKVKRKETFYSIAKKFEVSVEDIIKSNEGISQLRKGDRIRIPIYGTEVAETPIPTIAQNEASGVGLQEPIHDTIQENGVEQDWLQTFIDRESQTAQMCDEIEIVLLLPFMLNSEPTQQSALYVEFYEGLLLAVDEYKEMGTPIHIYAYDTEKSSAKVKELLRQSELKNADLIIGPVEDNLITLVAQFAQEHRINVVNAFSVKSGAEATHTNLFKSNVGYSSLYEKAASEFVKRFASHRIVFARNTSHPADKEEFVKVLKKALTAQAIPYQECSYTNPITLTRLGEVSPLGEQVVVVPEAASKTVLSNMLSSVAKLQFDNPKTEVTLFGYPEWQLYIPEFANNFFTLNTHIYTHFYATPTEKQTQQIKEKYYTWYSKNLIPAIPQYALLGYDTGCYFLNALITQGRNFEIALDKITSTGVQSDFDFERYSPQGGYVNTNLYMLQFTPDYTVKRDRIE